MFLVEEKAISLDQLQPRVREVVEAQLGPINENTLVPWIAEIFDEYVIVELSQAEYWRIPYTFDEESVELSDRTEWAKVERKTEWVEAKAIEMKSRQSDGGTVVYFGGSVKALGGGKVGGYLVQFGDTKNTDLEGDYFTSDTDFDIDDNLKRSTVYYNHGLDPVLKNRRLGRVDMSVKDAGIWLQGQLDLRDEYEQAVYQMVEAGKLGWSSGTAPHLVEREQKSNGAFHITHWPLGLDASVTPIPAEPRTAVIPIKSLKNVEPLQVDLTQQGSGEDSAKKNAHEVSININVNGQNPETTNSKPQKELKMEPTETPTTGTGDNPTTPVSYVTEDRMSDLETKMSDQMDGLSTMLNNIMEVMENSSTLKNVGYIAPDDEESRPEVKSFGDFLFAIKQGNTKRLKTVYGSIKDMSGETGAAGGYLVPEAFEPSLLRVTAEQSQIVSRVQNIPQDVMSGTWPSLDQHITPTAGSGQTALAGGLVATTTSAGGNLTETQPTFENLKWRVTKQGGFVEVDNELIEDSPVAIEALLTSLFNVTVNAKKEQLILRGTGAGEPEGILNAAAAIGIAPDTNNTFAYADALEMVSRFKMVSGDPVWIIHPSIWTDIGNFESANGGGVWQANHQAGLGQSLLGYPILTSEHLPQADNSGCVLLADLQAYLMFTRRGITIGFSEHAAFTSDKGTWRFTTRFDGMSWLNSAITLADPQGSYTVSPFVYLND